MSTAEVIIFPGADVAHDDLRNSVPLYGERRASVERYTGGIKCEDCGDQILPSRLRVKPNATRCIDCQIEAESQGWSAKQHKNPRQ